MNCLAWLFFLTATLAAQDVFERGAKVFQQTCAQGYCHGSGGTQGRAPKLIGRAYDHPAVLKIVRHGVANTGMPGFAGRLETPALDAVVAYVVMISGGDVSNAVAFSSAGAATPQIPADAKRGKELFTDAVRGVNRCNTCHILEGLGVPVGPNLAAGGPYDLASIRNGKPTTVRLATAGADRFAALVVEQPGDLRLIYDLSVVPPVLRTLNKSEVTFAGDSPWRHANAVANYNDGELTAIAAYLRWVAR
jgi:mono/diheme cytochrome c family protein